MPSVTLTFSAPLNVSCQVGDTAYYAQTSTINDSGNLNPDGFAINTANIVEIGQIRQITNPNSDAPTIICETTLSYASTNGQTRFIFFTKSNEANLTSLLGYYADTKLVNNSKEHAEIYAVTVDAFESSK
jgi:hypothetical protein